MKDKIPSFLMEKLNLNGFAQTGKFPEEIKQFMVDYSNYYDWDLGENLTKILKVMKQNISELPKCEIEGCENSLTAILTYCG